MKFTVLVLFVGLMVLGGVTQASANGKKEPAPTTCTPSNVTGYREGKMETPGCNWKLACPCDCKVKWDDADGITADALVVVNWSTLTQYSTHVWTVAVDDSQQLCSASGTILYYVIFTDNGTTPPSL